MKVKTAVLISGRGSNLSAILNASNDEEFPAEIALVLSNVPDVEGLKTAHQHGVETFVIDHRKFSDRHEFEAILTQKLKDHQIDLICLAGFMRLLTAEFVREWHDKIINIHPSLLPAFKGRNTHERALSTGSKIVGATVHFVRAEMDSGPIIVQGALAVFPDDTADSLAARMLKIEHQILPKALELVASGKARVVGEKVVIENTDHTQNILFAPDISI